MAGHKGEQWLIVQPVPAADERFSPLLPALNQLGLDAYSARQRLIGHAPALLARGRGETLQKVSALLAAHRFIHWLITPTPPRFVPDRIFGLHGGADAICFTCRTGEVVFPRGAPVLAILADLSGKMPEKQMQRLLAQNAYRGAEYLSPAAEAEIAREVLRGEPVLDLYLLSLAGSSEKAVRVFPGRFDPKGLKDKATLSAAGNLQAVLDQVREYCPTRLHSGFGLASLPGCQPKRPAPGVDHRRESLSALTRFGWLMVELEQAGTAGQVQDFATAQDRQLPVAALLAETLAPAHPALAAVGAAAGLNIPFPVDGRGEDPSISPKAGPAVAPGLPPPPATVDDTTGPSRNFLIWVVSLGAGLAALFMGGEELLAFLWRRGVQNGVLPAILSAACFLGGAQALRWKRRIEDTPTSRVRSLAMGMVEVHGRAVRQYALVSPMSHLACVWYRLRRYRRDGREWRLSSSRSSGSVPFLLDDGTGRVQIDPAGASVRAGSRQEGFPGGGSFLSSFGSIAADEKWVEEVIAEGTYLYVLGYAHGRRHAAPSLVERTRDKLRRLKGNAAALQRFDADGDGRISGEEWEVARSAMEESVLREQLSSGERCEEQTVIGRPPGRTLPFIIAETESEARLVDRYGWAAALLLMGGLLLAGWTAAIILPVFI